MSQYNTEDGTKTWEPADSSTITRRNGLYVVEELGISAGALRVDSTPVSLEGRMLVDMVEITHIPHCYKAGEIQIERV